MSILKVSAIAILLATGLSASGALAKAHDQGRADGSFDPDADRGARDAIDALTELGVLDGRGVSAVTKGGARGAAASSAGSDNAVDPQVGNGANSP